MSANQEHPNAAKRVVAYFVGLGKHLLELKDTPHAIAGGAAIGIFIGFTPLFGLKTLLCLGAAYLLRCNPIAAVIAVSLHDIVTPIWPFLLRIEYDIGYFLLSNPHHLPVKMEAHHLHLGELIRWKTFARVGLPMMLGSLFLAAPFSALTYAAVLAIVKRRERRKALKAQAAPPGE